MLIIPSIFIVMLCGLQFFLFLLVRFVGVLTVAKDLKLRVSGDVGQYPAMVQTVFSTTICSTILIFLLFLKA